MKNLYKYSNAENAKQALLESYIYLSSPEAFNDIYDTSLGFVEDDLKRIAIAEISNNAKIHNQSFLDIAKRFKPFEKNETETVYDRFKFIDSFLSEDNFSMLNDFGKRNQQEIFDELILKASEISGLVPSEKDYELINLLKHYDFNEFFNSLNLDNNEALNKLIQIIDGTFFRIGCLTENNKSNYMWGLYANNFKGVCLEYDFHKLYKEVDGDLYKISYEKSRPLISKDAILKLIESFGGDDEKLRQEFLKILTTKFVEFENEKEWRIIKDFKFNKLHTKSLKKIYIGYKLPIEDIAFFKGVAKQKNIELYELIKQNDSYEIHFEKIDI